MQAPWSKRRSSSWRPRTAPPSTTPLATRGGLTTVALLDHGGTVFDRLGLNVRPPLRHFLFNLASGRAQQQEIIGCAKPRMIEQTQRPTTFTLRKPGLQTNDLSQGQCEPLWYRHARLLTRTDLITSSEQCLNLRALLRLQFL